MGVVSEKEASEKIPSQQQVIMWPDQHKSRDQKSWKPGIQLQGEKTISNMLKLNVQK